MSSAEYCSKFCRAQFRLQNFKLEFENPELFVNPQYGPRILFPVWTVFWATFHVVILALQPFFLRDNLPDPSWFAYLTNWGYIMVALFSISDCAITLYVHLKKIDFKEQSSMPWYLKVLWVLYNLANVGAICVTILYYVLLEPDSSASSVLKHAINSVYIVLNLVYCAKPTYVLHLYQGVIFGVVYSVFSVVYQKSGGGPIYSVLDWDKPENTILLTLGTVIVAIPLAHIICFTIYTFRLLVSAKCRNGSKKIADTDCEKG